MATKKTTSKVSRKATLDININLNKSKNKKSKKQFKKLKPATILLIVAFFALGAVCGFFGVRLLTRNDCFTILGQDEITLQLNETYKDEGVKVVAFNKDVSKDIVIETNLLKDENGNYYAEEEATYYIIYTSKSFKYSSLFKIKKIRLVTFVEPTEESEIVNNQGGSNE